MYILKDPDVKAFQIFLKVFPVFYVCMCWYYFAGKYDMVVFSQGKRKLPVCYFRQNSFWLALMACRNNQVFFHLIAYLTQFSFYLPAVLYKLNIFCKADNADVFACLDVF